MSIKKKKEYLNKTPVWGSQTSCLRSKNVLSLAVLPLVFQSLEHLTLRETGEWREEPHL